MEFEWDPAKSEANIQQRGFAFAFASRVFEVFASEREDLRADYGERRIIAIGEIDGALFTVVYTDRLRNDASPVRRIISARVSTRKERRQYGEAKKESGQDL